MARRVYKYPVNPGVDPMTPVRMPVGAEIIHGGVQGDTFMVWAVADPDETHEETRKLFVVGTGRDLPPQARHHLGTVQHGPYVWHIFEDR